jgi:Secretion system C-terminal sorting domain
MMKKYLLFIFFFISFGLFAQTNTYQPFPEDSALWIVVWARQSSALPNRELYIMNGDTLIGGKLYNKLYRERNIYVGPVSAPIVLSPYAYLGALRQEIINKKVYWRGANMLSDTLLYNFNLKVGDTLPRTYLQVSGMYPAVVTSIRDTLMDKLHSKRYTFKTSSLAGHLIEGVGSDCGVFELAPYWEGGNYLTCFKTHNLSAPDGVWAPYSSCGFYNFPTGVNNKEKNSMDIEIYPNPSTGIFTIYSSEKFQFSAYDILGRSILQPVNSLSPSTILDLSPYPKGVYLLSIKTKEKIVARKIILQ